MPPGAPQTAKRCSRGMVFNSKPDTRNATPFEHSFSPTPVALSFIPPLCLFALDSPPLAFGADGIGVVHTAAARPNHRHMTANEARPTAPVARIASGLQTVFSILTRFHFHAALLSLNPSLSMLPGPLLIFKLLNQAAETVPLDLLESDRTSQPHLSPTHSDHLPISPARTVVDANLLTCLQGVDFEHKDMMPGHDDLLER